MAHQRKKMRRDVTIKKRRGPRGTSQRRESRCSRKSRLIYSKTRVNNISQWKYMWQNNKDKHTNTHTQSSKFSTDFDLRGFTLPTKPLLYSQPLQMNANTVTRFMLTQKDKTRKENFKNSDIKKTLYSKQTLLSTLTLATSIASYR